MDAKLKVKGMHCKSCEQILKEDLAEIAGISNVFADSGIGLVSFKAEAQEAVKKAKEA
ncbi:hypothetical protein COS70_05640, partial [Candidatus Micrarchaeota archaeon CG06_land_8_20_14_3_00_50_6]